MSAEDETLDVGNHTKNPYVGPQFFLRSQHELFKGREKETAGLADRLTARRLVLFYAESGAGKTSLINAGLIPLLEERGFEILPVARVAGTIPKHIEVANPYSYNVMAAIDQSTQPTERFAGQELSDFLLDLEKRDERFVYVGQEEAMPEPVEDLYADDVPEIPRRVLIIDQFEELFLTHPGPNPQELRSDFIRQVAKAMEDDPFLYVLLSMRADYVHHLLRYVRLLPDELRSRYYMSRLRYDQALRAVKEPAKLLSNGFADGVAEELVEQLARERAQSEGESNGHWVAGEIVEPVQLQVVCYQLWESLEPTENTTISHDDLMKVARGKLHVRTRQTAEPLVAFVESSLGSYYEYAMWQALARTDTDLTEEYLRDWFSRKLITSAGTRGFLPRGNESTAGVPEPVIEELERLHIVRGENRAGGRWIELIHDSFIDPVRRANFEWTQRRATTWVSAAYRWEARGRPRYLLLMGDQLKDALAEAGNLNHQPDTVREFLRAGEKAEDDARVQNLNRQKKLLIALIVVSVLALITGFTLALSYYRQFLDANQNSLSLQAARLSEEGQELFENRNLEGAMLLAFAAHERAQMSTDLDKNWLRRAERFAQPSNDASVPEDENWLRKLGRAVQPSGETSVPESAGLNDRSLRQVEDWLLHAMDEKAAGTEGNNSFRLESPVPPSIMEAISETQLYSGVLPGQLVAAAPDKRWTWNPLQGSSEVSTTSRSRYLLTVSDDGKWRAELAGDTLYVSKQPFSNPIPIALRAGQYEIYDAAFYPDSQMLLVAMCAGPTSVPEGILADRDINLTYDVPVEGNTENNREWRFEGVAGDRVQIFMVGLDQGVDPKLELLDRDSNPVAEDDNSGGDLNALINARLIGLGPYTIRTTSMEAGNYRLELSLINHAMSCQIKRVSSGNRNAFGTAEPLLAESSEVEDVWQSRTSIEGGIKDLALLNNGQVIWVDGGGSVSLLDMTNTEVGAVPKALEGVPDDQHTLSLLVMPELNRLITAGCIRIDERSGCQEDSTGFVQWWDLSETGPSRMGDPLTVGGVGDRQRKAPVVALAGIELNPQVGDEEEEPAEHPPTKLIALDKTGRITMWEANPEYWYRQSLCELAGRNLNYDEWTLILRQTGEQHDYLESLKCDQQGHEFGLDVSFALELVQACNLEGALDRLEHANPEAKDAFMADAIGVVFEKVIGEEEGAEFCVERLPVLQQGLDPAQVSSVLENLAAWRLDSPSSDIDPGRVDEVFEEVRTWPSPAVDAALVYVGKAYEKLCPLAEAAGSGTPAECPGLRRFLQISRDLDQQPVTGPYDTNDVSLWSFSGKRGEQIVLTMEGLDSGVKPFLELLDEQGLVLATAEDSDGSGDAQLEYTIVRAGQYLVRVTNLSRFGGRYQIELVRTEPSVLTYGQEFLVSNDEPAVWKFDGQAGDVVSIVVMEQAERFDPWLRVYDSAGKENAVAIDADGTQDGRIDIVLSATDEYIIDTSGFSAEGDYVFSLTVAEDTAPE